jgi:hypothetical protein
VETTPVGGNLLLAHQSNALIDVLRKFDCHSTNDIERLDVTAGPPEELETWLTSKIAAAPGAVSLQTSSGLGVNRIAPGHDREDPPRVPALVGAARLSDRDPAAGRRLRGLHGDPRLSAPVLREQRGGGGGEDRHAHHDRRGAAGPRRLRQHRPRRAGLLRGGAALRPLPVGGAPGHRGLAHEPHHDERRPRAPCLRAPRAGPGGRARRHRRERRDGEGGGGGCGPAPMGVGSR